MSAHIYSFNIGVPLEHAHSILHVDGHLPPYVAMTCSFWFDEQISLSTEQEQSVDVQGPQFIYLFI